jgi:hypothetical protein
MELRQIVDSFTDQTFVGIIMATVGDCNLATFMEGEFDADKISCHCFGCLASGMVAPHDANIGHKIVKPENCHNQGIQRAPHGLWPYQ